MIDWVRHLFAHTFPREIKREGSHSYRECGYCGHRTARWLGGCYSPVDVFWLERSPRPAAKPPREGSGIMMTRCDA